ncbi:porin [Pseudogemmobacter sonorensis]|uniref:porin n=1 Tax=Pseudogemmobacter sonorensis TaxID=2989681 RepID=UPI00369F0A19
MKKVLLATTVLVATAGIAAADVKVSGTGRLGITDNVDSGDHEFSSRIRVIFSLSGETDTGLAFGASVRADQDSNDANEEHDEGTIWVSGAFGRLTFGDVDSAFENAVGDLSGVGYIGLNDYNEVSYFEHDKTAVLYSYSIDAFSFYASAGQTGSDEYSVGVGYSTGDYTFGLGYASFDSVEEYGLSAAATFGDFGVKAIIADGDLYVDTAYGLSVDYTFDATTVTAYFQDGLNYDNTEAYGLGASYNLGGGASVVGGIAKKDGTDTISEIGLTFSF